MVQRITSLLPLISTVLVVFGIYNLNNYYNQYNIKIYNYLEVSEIIFSFTELFAILIPMGLLFILPAAFTYQIFWKPLSKSRYLFGVLDLNNEVSVRKYIKLINIVRYLGLLLVLLVLLLYFISLAKVFSNDIDKVASVSELYFNMYVLMIILGFAVIIITSESLSLGIDFLKGRINNYRLRRSILDKHIRYEVGVLLFATAFLYFNIKNNRSYHLNMNGRPKYQVSLEFQNETLTTNDTLLYVGSTKNFTFFHNKKSKQSLVLSNDKVKKTYIRELRGGL